MKRRKSMPKGTKPAREQARDQMDRGHGIVEKELMNGRVAEEMTEARKAPTTANLIGTATKPKGGNKDKGKGKNETRYC